MPNKPTVEDIVKVVGRFYRVRPEAILGPGRPMKVVEARHVAMYFVDKMTDLKLMQIAEAFNRKEHGTVIHAREKIKQWVNEGLLSTLTMTNIEVAINATI